MQQQRTPQQQDSELTSWMSKILSLRVRIIPMILFCATMLLSVKVYQFYDSFQIALEFNQAAAEEKKKDPKDEIPTQEIARDEFDEEEVIEVEFDPLELNQEQVNVLKQLTKRREQLKRREKSIDSREVLLTAVETKLNKKIDQLNGIKTRVEEILQMDDERKSDKIKKLVAVYEKMKPKDAAKILEGISLQVVVDIMSEMKEAKVSPIISKMDQRAAQILTLKLAERKKLEDKEKLLSLKEAGRRRG